jgi:hypothetical protein
MALILVSTPTSSSLCWLWMHQPWTFIAAAISDQCERGAKNHVAPVRPYVLKPKDKPKHRHTNFIKNTIIS